MSAIPFVDAIPALLLFEDGELLATVGGRSRETILESVSQLCG